MNEIVLYIGRISHFTSIIIILASASLLSLFGWFNLVSFALDPDFPALFSQITDYRFLIVIIPLGFFLYVWPVIFGQLLYQDLDLSNNSEIHLSIKHQNLFFII